MNEMFYQGDLQSGIATAMRDAKPVVCFVRDDLEESVTWESEFFDDEELSELLATRSVALRLIAGTQEAGFLTSICPIRNFPAVVVVRSGMLQEYIVAGTPKDIFQARLKKAIGNPSVPPDSAAVNQSPVMNAPNNTNNAATTLSHIVNTDGPHVSALPITRAQPIPATIDGGREESVQVPTSQIITPETRTQLNRESIRAGKQPATAESAEQKKLSQEKEERRALQTKLQRERNEQMEERERIRNQIKKDQEARRRRADEEKQSFASATSPVRVSSSGGNTKTNTKSPSQYRLQIRLFDGKSVRNTFPSTATIRKDVRPWLESQRSDGTAPYNLKHILTPLPNHTISVAEEERTLEDLELGPTASLVMVPVPSYIEAYAPSGLINSAPARVLSSGFGLLSGLVGGVTGAVGGLLGYGNSNYNQETSTSDKQSESRQTSSPPAARSGQRINIRTLHDQRSDREEREFYNGNTLNFEPRRDDDSKDK